MHRACSAPCPWPVCDITFNAQREEVDEREANEWISKAWERTEIVPINSELMDRFLELCASSRRPLVCIGGGAVWADSLDRFIEFLRKNRIPYVSTLMGAQFVEKHNNT